MRQHSFGSLPPVSTLTLGGGGLGMLWGPTTFEECVATVHAAVEAGLLDPLAEGIVGYGQIRPLAPYHVMSDTYASMIAMIKDVCGARLLGRSIFDVEGIHAIFDTLAPANFMARAAFDIALYDAIGKAAGRPIYNLIGGLCQERIPLEWSISMASGVRPEEDGGRRRARAP